MLICADCAYKSLFKFHEELCGDKVEILRTEDAYIMILADGMGSGVEANILATLTSKILGTMFLKGASLEESVETIIKTLPVSQKRQVAYSTFSILQVFRDGRAYLVEFDNPTCLLIRDGVPTPIPFGSRRIEGKLIRETRFNVRTGDTYILVSDGAIHAGVGQKELAFGWGWDRMAAYVSHCLPDCGSAARLAHAVCQKADCLYGGRPGDDTTVAVMQITEAQVVHLMTGPPQNPADDARIVEALMSGHAYRIVCGGTSATIVSRELKRPLRPTLDFSDPEIPPVALLDGVDLVTEGVLTLNRAVALLRRYAENAESDNTLYAELDKGNAGSRIAKTLIEHCTDLNLYVGRAVNMAHQNPDLPFDLGIRQTLVDQLKALVEKMGKKVTVTYF